MGDRFRVTWSKDHVCIFLGQTLHLALRGKNDYPRCGSVLSNATVNIWRGFWLAEQRQLMIWYGAYKGYICEWSLFSLYSSCFLEEGFVSVNRDIGLAVRVFANGPGDLGSIPGRVIPKTLKMVLDTTLFNTQHYKVRFKGKVEQSWEWSSALPYTLV